MIATTAPDFLSAQLFPFAMMVTAIVLFMVGQISRTPFHYTFALASTPVVAAFIVGFGDGDAPYVSGILVDDISRIGLRLLIPAVALVSLMMLQKPGNETHKSSALVLLWISCLGGMMTLVCDNWMMFFIGLQCLSLPLYGLLAYDCNNQASIMSSMRYLVLSFIAMAFMLFGILLLYAATGTMDIYQQGAFILGNPENLSSLFILGALFVLVGLLFKASLFPFHIWAPAVYQGAPLFVIGFMIVVVKSFVVMFLLRMFFSIFGVISAINSVMIAIAIISMWLGNGLMLVEKRFLRILAFISIAHLGYLVIPLLSQSAAGTLALLIDLAAFGLATLVALSSIKLLNKELSMSCTIDEFHGLFHKHPFRAGALAIALLSIAGIPLTAGFIGKYSIIAAGIESEMWSLVINMIVSSVCGFFVIARIIVLMLEGRGETRKSPQLKLIHGVVFAAALALIGFGTIPEPWISWTKSYVHDGMGIVAADLP